MSYKISPGDFKVILNHNFVRFSARGREHGAWGMSAPHAFAPLTLSYSVFSDFTGFISAALTD